MRLDALFHSKRGHDLDRNSLEDAEAPAGVNYVSRVGRNNGVSGRVLLPSGFSPEPAGALTVALGSRNFAMATFVQPEPFATGQNIQILTPRNPDMPLVERLWWASCITANRFRFGFGRYANRTLDSLELPDSLPDWLKDGSGKFSALLDGPSSSALVPPSKPLASIVRWGDFAMNEICEVRKGSRITKRQRVPGDTIYVGTAKINNGWVDRVSATPEFPAWSISVPYNGNVGYAFLQPVPFCASDDVHVLIPPPEAGIGARLFICSVIRNERYRFSWGRKWNLERMARSTLRLPATENGEPAWALMEEWIASRPFSRTALSFDGSQISDLSSIPSARAAISNERLLEEEGQLALFPDA
ncbi:restriction endonuclease subunit S [Micromonospora zamorensis]|uniref:restriction endonuclease subunit S n=1 Tax=Micromonospora zamorensis TaxID=709883 RepID=UPI002ED018A7|nr:restriction endonuclease subunit S [Micromonospora zamorensis]